MHRPLAVAMALIVAALPQCSACDLCAVYNASSARGENQAGFHLSLAEQFTHAATLQENGHEIDDPVNQYRDSSITTLLVGYNFTPRVGLSLHIPYIHRSFRRAEGFDIERGTVSGLGDIALLAHLGAIKQFEHDYSISLSFFAGVEFPTGDSERLREEVNEVETPGAPESGVHGDDLALGSGSFDAITGLSSRLSWKRLFFSADVQYFIRTRGDFSYRFGNELVVAGGPGAYLLFREELTLALQAVLNYETKSRDRIAGVKRHEGLVTSWYAGPGVIFTLGERFSATAHLDIPLEIINRSVQTVADYRLRAGLTWAF
jgi:hypothetical protein